MLERELQSAAILIDDTPLRARESQHLDRNDIAERFPALVHVSVLPFGASGPKADWDGEEVNLLHAGGEGFLLPNGLSYELFPERPPLKIYGHFSGYQGGSMAAFAALSAWWAVPAFGGQYVDVSVQDAVLSVGAFALQRLGDGSLEHRSTRRFRYGGVFEAQGGFVELLTLEDRQWIALVELLGRPVWAQDEALRDPLERSRRGGEINDHIREWMRRHDVDDIVQLGAAIGGAGGEVSYAGRSGWRRARTMARSLRSADVGWGDTGRVPGRAVSVPLHTARGRRMRVPALGEMTQEPAA